MANTHEGGSRQSAPDAIVKTFGLPNRWRCRVLTSWRYSLHCGSRLDQL